MREQYYAIRRCDFLTEREFQRELSKMSFDNFWNYFYWTNKDDAYKYWLRLVNLYTKD